VPNQENNIEELERRFPTLAGAAFAAARARVLAAGLSVLESDQGRLYEVFPDGRRVLVKIIEAPMPNIPGRRIIIW
jgi:hypothetical protein